MRHPATLALAAILLASTGRLAAQSAADSTVPDSTPHKHGGLFGKAKSFIGNKTVKVVAKTVACTMVPGGQAIASAMDAASSKNAEGAAASGGAGCMPGGMGLAGAAGIGGAAGMAAAGMSSPAGIGGPAGNAASASQLAAMAAKGRGAPSTGTMPAMGYSAGAGVSEEDFAKCLGLSASEYRDFVDPTHGEARQPTKKELDRQAKLSRKVDMQRYQGCMTAQASAAQTAEAQATLAGATEPAPAEPEAVAISADPVGELRKGRTTVRKIGWAPGAAELSDGAGAAFGEAMTRLALAVRQAGGTYRVDIYLESQVDKASAGRIGAARLTAVQDALDHAGLPSGLVVAGKSKVDKNDRLEFVRTKK